MGQDMCYFLMQIRASSYVMNLERCFKNIKNCIFSVDYLYI